MVVCGPAWGQPVSAVTGYWSDAGQNGCPATSKCFIQYGKAGPLGPIPVVPTPAPTTEASSTITVGGTFQQIAAANTSRKSIEFANLCAVASACTATTNYCYLFFAASGSPSKTTNVIPVPPGASYLRSSGSIPSDAVQATCDGTGDHYRLAVQ